MERIKYKGTHILRINDNTQVMSDRSFKFEDLGYTAPKKILTRIELNLGGLNRLATTIVTPDKMRNLDIEDLWQILRFSNDVNKIINLPNTDSLILRSAYITPGTPSEPALLIKNLHSPNIGYEYLDGNSKTKLIDHNAFTQYLRNNTHLLIHDDNYEMQTAGIHVRTYESLNGDELLFGTDCLQARELEMETKKKPSISVNISHSTISSSYKMSKLFNIDPTDIEHTYGNGNGYLATEERIIRVRNIDKYRALKLVEQIKKDKESLLEVHRVGQEMKGQNAVVESRIYPNLAGGVGRRVQVLDVDK